MILIWRIILEIIVTTHVSCLIIYFIVLVVTVIITMNNNIITDFVICYVFFNFRPAQLLEFYDSCKKKT